jgi:glucose/arabinose dehydrogenase
VLEAVLEAVLVTVLAAACSPGTPSTPSGSGPATSTTTPPTTMSTTGSSGATAAPPSTSRPGAATGSAQVVRTVATGLDVPWGLARLPDGAVLITSRDTFEVTRLDVASGRLTTAGTVPGVVTDVSRGGEGGLLGIAVSPRFASDRTIFVYLSTQDDNRVAAMTYDPSKPAGSQLGPPRAIVTGIPHGIRHNGGRLAFGPDGYLYATTGESGNPPLAQDRSSLGGKILRMTPEGRPAPGNPFGTLVWSFGHRNVQGIAWDAGGRLWASEFGDHTEDELNLILPGHNYGWPQTEGITTMAGITGPVAQWGPPEDSPSGIAIAGGSVWMAALRGERLWRIPLNGSSVAAQPQDFLVGSFGRLRSVLALDGSTLLLTTSNRDGRAQPQAGDDRVLVVKVS